MATPMFSKLSLESSKKTPSRIYVCNLLRLRTTNVKIFNKRKRFPTNKKTRSRRHPAETMTDADYSNDLALLANTSTYAEFQLHSQGQAAGCIGLYINTNTIGFMYFKLEGTIFTLSGKPLNAVNLFTYIGSNISSDESDFTIHRESVDWYFQVFYQFQIWFFW